MLRNEAFDVRNRPGGWASRYYNSAVTIALLLSHRPHFPILRNLRKIAEKWLHICFNEGIFKRFGNNLHALLEQDIRGIDFGETDPDRRWRDVQRGCLSHRRPQRAGGRIRDLRKRI